MPKDPTSAIWPPPENKGKGRHSHKQATKYKCSFLFNVTLLDNIDTNKSRQNRPGFIPSLKRDGGLMWVKQASAYFTN